MFPSPSILQHYDGFNTRTIATLEKLLGAGSFGGFIGHLVHCHAILPTFSNGFGLLSIVWIASSTFLGCWALITLTLVIHFQQNDHLILLDTVAHVEIGIFPFQMALRDTQAMLP
jgi:hypothetical protein